MVALNDVVEGLDVVVMRVVVVVVVGVGGMSTVSMMCTTPFVAAMSAAMTLELRLMRTLLRGEWCTLSMA